MKPRHVAWSGFRNGRGILGQVICHWDRSIGQVTSTFLTVHWNKVKTRFLLLIAGDYQANAVPVPKLQNMITVIIFCTPIIVIFLSARHYSMGLWISIWDYLLTNNPNGHIIIQALIKNNQVQAPGDFFSFPNFPSILNFKFPCLIRNPHIITLHIRSFFNSIRSQ